MTTTAVVELDAGTPRVRIDTDTGATAVYRKDADGATLMVRGTPSGGTIYDYEAPQESPVSYVAGADETDPVMIPDVGVWLIPAADPDAGCSVVVEHQGIAGLTRTAGVATAAIPGRRNGFAVSWARQALAGSMALVVLDGEAHARLTACLERSGPFFMSAPERVAPLREIPWAVLGDASEDVLDATRRAYRVTVPLVPIDRPVIVTARSVTIDNLTGTIDSLTGTINDLGA